MSTETHLQVEEKQMPVIQTLLIVLKDNLQVNKTLLHAKQTYLKGAENHLQVEVTRLAIVIKLLLTRQFTLPINALLLFIQQKKLPANENLGAIAQMAVLFSRHVLLIFVSHTKRSEVALDN